MNQHVTPAIVLTRTDYNEADRIVTLLTPEQGKLRLLAKGVRRVKSKLAGGIELFSVSTIVYIKGRGEIGTLVSAQLDMHYRHIVQQLERTMLGYELIKLLHKNTEDQPEPAYFTLLNHTFAALDNNTIATELVRLWFGAQLLQLAGHAPNLHTDIAGRPLQPAARYNFSFEQMCFEPHEQSGRFGADHIKFLRLVFAAPQAALLAKVQGGAELVTAVAPLIATMLREHLRV